MDSFLRAISNIVVSFLCLILPFAAISQTYDFEDVGDKKKLQEKYIYDICQMSDHRLSLGTEDGLVLFDGEKFTPIKLRENQDLNILNKIFIDANGNTFLGYFDGEVILLEKDEIALQTNIPGKIVKFSEDANGQVYFLVQGKGIYSWNNGDAKNIALKGVNDQEIYDFEFVKDGLIVGIEKNLKFYDKDFNLKGSLDALMNEEYVVSKPVIYKMPKSSKILVVDDQNTFIWLDYNNSGEFSFLSAIDLSVIESRVEDISFDGDSGLWIASKSNGLFKMKLFNGSIDSYNIKNYSKENGLITNQLKSVHYDMSGILWIGYYGYGLSKLDNENIVLIEELSGVKLADINAVESNLSGELLLGTDEGFFKATIGVKSNIEKIDLTIDDAVVTSIGKTKTDEFWIGTRESGLFKVLQNGDVIDLGKKYGLKIDRINSIEVNDNGNVYIATDLGLFYYSKSNDHLQRISTNEGLVHNVLNDVYLSRDSTLWFAANGASLFSYKNLEYTVHKNIDNLNQYILKTVVELEDGGICFGTETDGIFILRNDSVVQISTENGLLSNSVYGLIQEDNGLIWAFHKSSITKFNPELKVVQYLESSDLYDVVIGEKSFYKDIGGVIWLGTNKGLLRFDNVVKTDTVSPTLVIESVFWNDEEISEIPKESPFGSYSLRIKFLGVDLKRSDDIQYEFKLEGYDDIWNRVGKDQNFAYYPKLKDGEYKFLIRAISAGGKSSEVRSFEFVIDIPFWKSWWFIICAPSLLVIIIFGIVQLRFSRVKRQKLELENIVRKRTKELREEKNNLSEAKELIEYKNKEITDSINYAERIQKALLPNINQSNLKVAEMFVFFSPCDIVSGDFYWLGNKNGMSIAVVADCTGHGVPGAFMSMISSTLLDKIILDNGEVRPEKIVELLDQSIVKTLKSKSSKTKDGIDIGVIVVDDNQKKIIYCGASRPLFMFRNNTLKEFKGGMLSIGEFIEDMPKEYVRHEIEYQAGDQFYLSSDGFPDQFGGPRDKKYMVGKFKKFLGQLSSMPFDRQQGVMMNEFQNWKGGNHQTDDVLVIGIKM